MNFNSQKTLVMAIVLSVMLVVGFNSASANFGKSKTNSTASTPITAVTDANTEVLDFSTVDVSDAVFIFVPDTSGSVKSQLAVIKEVTKNLVSKLPLNTKVAIIGINSRETAALFPDKSSKAIFASNNDFSHADNPYDFIDSLMLGKFTDLNLANQTAFSLIERAKAKKSVVIYLTDGKSSLPPEMKDKSSFSQLLISEFNSRSDSKAIVLRVGDTPLEFEKPEFQADPKNVASVTNIKVLPLQNWQSALDVETNNTLSKQIVESLPKAKKVASSEEGSGKSGNGLAPNDKTASDNNGYIPLAIFVAIFLVGAGGFYWASRQKVFDFSRAKTDKDVDGKENVAVLEANAKAGKASLVAVPENVRKNKPQQPVKQAPSEVVIVEVSSKSNDIFERRLLRPGEQIEIGASSFVDFTLPNLHQSHALTLHYSGGDKVTGFVIDSDGKELDEVKVSGKDVEPQFEFSQQDELIINNQLQLIIIIADEDSINLFDVTETLPKVASVSNKPQKGRLLRRS